MYFLLLRTGSTGMRDISVTQDEYTAFAEGTLLLWDMGSTLSQSAVLGCPCPVTPALSPLLHVYQTLTRGEETPEH